MLSQTDNFSQWKHTVGLPSEFPELRDLTDDEIDPQQMLYLGITHSQVIEEIIDASAGPRLAVLVEKGHGCTTLARYIFKETSHYAVRRKIIPVAIQLEHLPDSPRFQQSGAVETGRATLGLPALQAEIRSQLVRSLVFSPWERAFGQRPYARLVGAVKSGASNVETQRFLLRAALAAPEGIDWLRIEQLAPELSAPLSVLLAQLASEYGVQVSLQIDFSSGESACATTSDRHRQMVMSVREHERRIVNMGRVLKGYHEVDAARAEPILPTTLNELFFIAPQDLELVRSDWDRDFYKVQYPWYRPFEVFAVLSNQYSAIQRSAEGQRRVPISALIDSAILSPHVAQDIPIRER